MTVPLVVRSDEKVLVLGDFRSGKTTLAKAIAATARKSLVFDPVMEYGDGQRGIAALRAAYAATGRGIYQPLPLSDLTSALAEFCRFALEQSDTVIVIDEPTLAIEGPRVTVPREFNALYRLGHKRGLGIVIATHRYRGDLPALFRLVHHYFIFSCGVDVDRMALRDVVGEAGSQWLQNPPRFAFWHRGPGHSGPCAPLALGTPAPPTTPAPQTEGLNTLPEDVLVGGTPPSVPKPQLPQ